MDIIVHNHQATMTKQLRQLANYRVEAALDRQRSHVDRVQVWLSDEGERNGEHFRCRMLLHFRNGGQVVVEETCTSHGAAVTRCASALERAVRRRIDKQQKRVKVGVMHAA